jgi:predicted nuclease of predicted toxin-antitoxin system
VKLLVDNQLPVALARYLTSLGHDCEHVAAVHLDAASDGEIWQYASERGSVVVSKDEDFLYLAIRAEGAARFVWVRLGNCRTSALIEAFDQWWPRIEQTLVGGERVVEIR